MTLRSQVEKTIHTFFNSQEQAIAQQDPSLFSTVLAPTCTRHLKPASFLASSPFNPKPVESNAEYETRMRAEVSTMSSHSIRILDLVIDAPTSSPSSSSPDDDSPSHPKASIRAAHRYVPKSGSLSGMALSHAGANGIIVPSSSSSSSSSAPAPGPAKPPGHHDRGGGADDASQAFVTEFCWFLEFTPDGTAVTRITEFCDSATIQRLVREMLRVAKDNGVAMPPAAPAHDKWEVEF
ncbi:hypothetical protein F5Y15DRAFT_147606 [Xylariaceae sp. FL0016]|nr:hypothetical protein F5Y15DRAFT_147606 [Xylariaceae sp. FL0016]